MSAGAPLQLALCRNFQHELRAILAEWPGLAEHVCVPASCQHPTLDWSKVERLPGAAKERPLQLLGGSCLIGLGTPPRAGWQGRRLTHRHALVAGETLVESALREGAYLLTPGWLEHWREHLAGWGFDAAGVRAFFAETTKVLVLFDTGVLPDSERQLLAMAAHLGLPFRRIQVGLDHLRLFLANEVTERRVALDRAAESARLAQANRQSADLLMTFEVVSTLTGMTDAHAAVARLLALFEQLFAPRRLAFQHVLEGALDAVQLQPARAPHDPAPLGSFAASGDELLRLGEDGFLVRFAHHGETLGALLVEGLRFPAHREHYLALALPVARVGGLALANARTHDALQRTIAELRAADANVAVLEGLIPICAYCKKIRDDQGYWQAVEQHVRRAPGADFTHSICSSCMETRFPELPTDAEDEGSPPR